MDKFIGLLILFNFGVYAREVQQRSSFPSLYSSNWGVIKDLIKREVKREVSNELVKWSSINGLSINRKANRKPKIHALKSYAYRKQPATKTTRFKSRLNRYPSHSSRPRSRKVNKPVETFVDKTCSLWGSGHFIHYKTFDSNFYDLTNNFCVYTILKTDDKMTMSEDVKKPHPLQIDVQTKKNNTENCETKTVFVKLNQKSTIHMKMNTNGYVVDLFEPNKVPIVNCTFDKPTEKVDEIRGGFAVIDDDFGAKIYKRAVPELESVISEVENPKCEYYSNLGNFKIEYSTKRATLSLKLPSGVIVEISKFGRVGVKLNDAWKKKVDGLCGNYDGSISNDVDKAKSMKDWANSWNYLNFVNDDLKFLKNDTDTCSMVEGVRLCRSIYSAYMKIE